MQTRKSGIIALVFGAAVLGACEQKAPIVNIPPTPTVTTVTISGAPTQAIKKGTTVQLVAVVSGNDNQAVTWSVLSGGTAASVSATGLVTALQPGVAVIQAQSQAVASAKAAVSITVADTTGGTIGQPSVTIGSITQQVGGLNQPVNLGNVSGQIDITMNVDIPTGVKATGLQLSVKNLATGATVVIPCQTFTATGSSDVSVEGAQAPQTVICSIPTNQVGANGVPTFPNGQYQTTAQLLNGSTVIASAVTQTMVFNNVSSLIITTSAAKTAPDAGGLVWNGGNLSVVVTPSIFTATTFQTFTVTVTGRDTTGTFRAVSKTVSTSGVAPVTVVFRSDSSSSAGLGLSGIEDASVTVGVTAVTTAGTQFDNNGLPFTPLPTNAMKYDAAAPRLGAAVTTYNLIQQPTSLQWWLNANSTFTTSCTTGIGSLTCGGSSTAAKVTGVVENGVDLVTWQFQTSPASASPLTWTTQSSLAGIGNQPAGSLVARIVVCDNLGNCKNGASANNSVAFGVDLVAPIINAMTSVSGLQTSPVNVTVAAQDTGVNAAGFPLQYIQVQIQKDSASTSGADVTKCVAFKSANATPTPDSLFSVPSSGCPFKAIPVNNGTMVTIDNTVTGNGYYTVTARAIDVANNVSTTTQRFFLIDPVPPTVSGIAITYTTGAATAVLAGTIHDNVDLQQWNTREQYAAPIIGPVTNLPFTQPTTVKAYGIPVQGNAAPNLTLAFVGGISTVWAAPPIPINGLGFSALDQAGLYTEAFQAFTAAPAAVTNTDVQRDSLSISQTPICQTGSAPPCTNATKTSTTLTAQVVMTANATPNPIVTVYFFYWDGAHSQLLGSSSAGNLVIPSQGQQYAQLRVYNYTLTAPASAFVMVAPLPAPAPLWAVGVDKNGVGVLLGSISGTTNPVVVIE